MSAALHASRVQARNVSLFGQARVDSLHVFGLGAHNDAQEPALAAENVTVAYNLSPLRRRHITSVTLDALRVLVDARGGPETAPSAPAPVTDAESGAASFGWRGNGWMPAYLRVNRFSGSAELPWLGASLNGLSVEYTARRDERLLSVQGDNATGEWWRGEPNAQHKPIEGALRIDVHDTQYGLAIDPIRIDLGKFITAHGAVRHGTERSRTELQLRLDDLTLGAFDGSAASGKRAFPIAFDALKLAKVRAVGSWTGAWGSVAEATLRGEANNLRIGPSGAPLYQGNLTLDVATPAGAASHFHSNVVFGKGQKATINLDASSMEFPTQVTFANWSREQWLDLVPSNLRPRFEVVPGIGRLSGDADLSYIAGGVYGKVTLRSEIGSGAAARERTVDLEIVEPPFWSPEPRKITAALGLPEQGKDSSVRVEFTGEPESSDSAFEVALANVQTENLASALGMANYFEKCAATATGKLNLRQSNGAATGTIDLRADTLTLADLTVPGGGPVAMKGQFSSKDSFATVAISDAELATKAFAFRLENGTIAADSGAVHTNAALRVDLKAIAQHMGWGALQGTADIKGALAHNAQRASAEFSGAISGLPWQNGPAQNDPVALAGNVEYDYARREGAIKKFSLHLDNGTALTCDSAVFSPAANATAIPFSATSDLHYFVTMGWAGAAIGHAQAAGSLYREDGATRCESALNVRAESLAFPNGIAAFTGMDLDAQLALGSEASGDGTIRAATATLAGATFSDLNGALELTGGAVNLPKLTASVFGGTVSAAVNARPLGEHRPVRVAASLAALDLDAFTKVFKLSGAALTGTAHGEVRVELEDAALTALNLTLKCDRGFTVSKTLLEQLLVSGAVKGFTGANTLEKMMGQIVGAAEQRPFDSAELTLRYETDGLKGQAILRSKGLNLTIDLNIEPAALKAAIDLQQQTQLNKVANVSAEPVQS